MAQRTRRELLKATAGAALCDCDTRFSARPLDMRKDDADAGRFTGESARWANFFVSRQYRPPYVLPKETRP